MKTVGLEFPVAELAPAEKHVCPHCGKTYKSAEALAKHILEKHPDNGKE